MARRSSLDLDEFAPYRLSVAANAVSRFVATAYAQIDGMSNHEWRVLAILGDGGKLGQTEVVERSRMAKVPVSRAVAALQQRGWVRRSTDADDRRARRLELTAAGRRIYERIVPAALEREHAVLAGLTAAERAQLKQLLRRVQQAADAAMGEPWTE